MKGYIYTMFRGADPGYGWVMNDPIFSRTPTLGACMPNIRRVVTRGDYIFVISGRIPGVRQYIVGGFRVQEKIDALAAYHRFPQNRLSAGEEGGVSGNIIVDDAGSHHPLDDHGSFERRIENYIVGSDPVALTTDPEIERGRADTLQMLNTVFGSHAGTVSEAIGRWRRLHADQVSQLLAFLRDRKN